MARFLEDVVVSQHGPSVDLQQAAAELNIEPWRLSRLGRYLRIDVHDKCIPRSEIERARGETNSDNRYLVVLQWLLGEFRAQHDLP